MHRRTYVVILLFLLLALASPAHAVADAPGRMVVFEAFMRST